MKLKLISVCIASLFATSAFADEFTIRDIRIEGLNRMEPTTVFSYLPIKTGDTFTDTKGEQTIKNLYDSGFFDDIQVETQGDVVLLTVIERPVISSFTVKGGKVLGNADIEKNFAKMGIARAKLYNPVSMAQAVEGLKYEYTNRGKNSVSIEPTITPLENNRVAIELNINEGDTTVIRNIDFSGNQHYSSSTLRKQMNLSEKGMLTWISRADRFSPDKLSEDMNSLAEFYHNHGYFNFKVISTDVKPNAKHAQDLDLLITVNEGERYRFGELTVSGDTKEIPLEEIQKLAKVKTGKWYNRSELNKVLEKIQNKLGEAGYATAEIGVQPMPRENNVLDFGLNIDTKNKIYVNEIHISGNNKTRDEVIRRELRQVESSIYDTSKIKRSQERLQQLGYFDKVEITQTPVEGTPDQVDLNVSVKEQPTGSIDISAGYVQGDGVVLSGGISQDNIFGSGKSASMRVSNSSSTKVASLSFTDPYFTADGVSLGYDAYWRSYDPNKVDISAYKTETFGGGARMGIPITEYDRINLGLGANSMKIKLFPYSPKRYRDYVEKFGEKNWTLTGNIGWGRNTTDSSFWPTRGYITSVDLNAGLPGGDIKYYKLTHSQSWFFPLTNNLTLQLGGSVGYGNGYGKYKELPFFHNFYGGGLGSVRGYESGSVGPKGYDGYGNIDYMGGNKQANMNVELLFPMPGMKSASRTVRLSLFADAGSVWDGKRYTKNDYAPYKDGHTSSFSKELRYSTGLAFTWISPLGPMKFSYAYPLNKKDGDQIQRFQFQLGTVF